MTSFPSDYARIEWSFIENDDRWYKMPDTERLAYLCFWVYSVATRRDWWMPEAFAAATSNVALHARIPPEAMQNMLDSALASGLLSRKPGGAYLLDGVRAKHPKLRGWCKPWGSSRERPKTSTRRVRDESSRSDRGF